jgi:hypothetical protein
MDLEPFRFLGTLECKLSPAYRAPVDYHHLRGAYSRGHVDRLGAMVVS